MDRKEYYREYKRKYRAKVKGEPQPEPEPELREEFEPQETQETQPQELVFTPEQSIEERIRLYKNAYPTSTYTPNWVLKGFPSRQAAIDYVIAKVASTSAVKHAGLGID